MEILNQYAVFILFGVVGLLMYFLVPFIFIKINTKQLDNYLCQHLLIVTSRLFIISAIGGALFKLTGTMFNSRLLQAGFFTIISVIIAESLTYIFFNHLKSVTEEEIKEYDLKDNYEKVTLLSPFFILWLFYTFMISISSYICAFKGIEKITPTIAITFIVFVINLFLGIEFTNRISNFLKKITIEKKENGNEK